jgi:hypothetical protein
MTTSPYFNLPTTQWADKTQDLIKKHSLSVKDIQDIAISAWDILWQTKIGDGLANITLKELDLPATVIGYFFEKLFAYKLNQKYPNNWRGSLSKEDKDIVCIANSDFSIEIKTSGQDGTKIYGNRSYGKASKNQSLVKKEKSGYYITVNFYQNILTLIRFGWIDGDDWIAQGSESGQMAGLKQEVYDNKLFAIYGEYLLKSPLFILQGVGNKTLENLEQQGITTILDVLQMPDNNSFGKLMNIKKTQLFNLYKSQNDYYNDNNLLKQVSWFVFIKAE